MGPDDQVVVPMLDYEDGAAAMDWLAAAFGFVERTRMVDPQGRVEHGEMLAGDGLVMVASAPSPHYESPRTHRERCATARAWSATPYIVDGVLVYVSDVDAHYRRAERAGARILSPPEEGVGRFYRVEDLEGHRWMFMQRPQ